MGEAGRAKSLLLLLGMRLGLFGHASATAKKHKTPSSRDGLSLCPEILHARTHAPMCARILYHIGYGQSPSGFRLSWVSISHTDCSSQ